VDDSPRALHRPAPPLDRAIAAPEPGERDVLGGIEFARLDDDKTDLFRVDPEHVPSFPAGKPLPGARRGRALMQVNRAAGRRG
jgi:hypothetical protein